MDAEPQEEVPLADLLAREWETLRFQLIQLACELARSDKHRRAIQEAIGRLDELLAQVIAHAKGGK